MRSILLLSLAPLALGGCVVTPPTPASTTYVTPAPTTAYVAPAPTTTYVTPAAPSSTTVVRTPY